MIGFDDIIVGSGTAGVPLAARLSEDEAARVLALENDGADRGVMVAKSESGLFHGNAGDALKNHMRGAIIKDSANGGGGSNGPSILQSHTVGHAVVSPSDCLKRHL